jgi:Raf kinase inhibitor-like YbhB/YbcL family protein
MVRNYFLALMALAIVVGLSPVQTHAAPAPPFILKSKSFQDNAVMADRYSGAKNVSTSNCAGQNISPDLNWENIPPGTKSLALTMGDSEGRAGLGANHLVVYGIPASVFEFKEGDLNAPSEKYVGGKSLMDIGTYTGPCTRPGTFHHYVFTLIATDLEPKALQPGLTIDELLAALKGHALGAVSLVGRSIHYEH